MIHPDDVARAYELTEPSTEFLSAVCEAVNSYVWSLPDIDLVTQETELHDGTGEVLVSKAWGPETRLGALMLAARLYERRDSRGGVISLGESITYISKHDADVARLLRLESWAKPKVA